MTAPDHTITGARRRPRSSWITRASRYALTAAIFTSTLVGSASTVHADAAPTGGRTWVTLQGTCDGEAVAVLEPLGGSTGFVIDGSVVVGKRFTLINDATGTVVNDFTEGKGVAQDRLIECVFVLPDYELPGIGVLDLRFVVFAMRPGS